MAGNQAQAVGTAFLQAYYSRLDSAERGKMHEFYHDDAEMVFENKDSKGRYKGKAAIQGKFMSIGSTATGSAATLSHNIVSYDCSFSVDQNVLIMITGTLKIDNCQNALQYVQVLHLVKKPTGLALQNDVFRFVYAAREGAAPPAPQTEGENLAIQFLKVYYSKLDTAQRVSMHELYRDDAEMMFENVEGGKGRFVGKAAIQGKFMSIGSTATAAAAGLQHSIVSYDVTQATPVSHLIMITGIVKIDGGNPLQYVQCLHLVKQGSYSLKNDVFRFVMIG